MAILNGGGAYGVKTVNSQSRKGNALVSVASAITIMIAFGTFVLVLVQVVIAIINSTKK